MTSDLKIAYILHRFPGITETFIMREIYWIVKQGIDVTIFSLLSPKQDIVHDQARELLPRVCYSPFLSLQVAAAQIHFLFFRPLRYLLALTKTIYQTWREPGVLLRALVLFPKSVFFSRQIENAGIDHVHAHFVWIEGIAAGVVTDLTGISFSIHPHAFGLFGRNQKNVRRELENASQIITISNYHRTYIATLCPDINPQDIEVVYCGVETDSLKPAPTPSDETRLRILSVGRLIEKKGFEYLIDACALLVKAGLKFDCCIAGDGPRKNALQARINAKGLQNYVHLLGTLNQRDITACYQQSHIFALPCIVAQNGDRDGIPVVLMEAMACALPVITTGVTGIPDLVCDNTTGLLVSQRNADELARALKRLITNCNLRMRLGHQGRLRVLEDFQASKNAARMVTIFQKTANKSQPRDSIKKAWSNKIHRPKGALKQP